MSKKTILLALGVVSAALLALPSMAMAAEEDVPLHIVPAPTAPVPFKGGETRWETVFGTDIICKEVNGEAKFENGTTGKITFHFKNECQEPVSKTSCGEITTTEVQFHLVTLTGNIPGILVTTNAGHFVTFTCTGGSAKFVFSGNGIVGRITSPACGAESTTLTMSFTQTKGVQEQKTVEGTATIYHLNSSLNGGTPAEMGWTSSGTMTFEGRKKLECT